MCYSMRSEKVAGSGGLCRTFTDLSIIPKTDLDVLKERNWPVEACGRRRLGVRKELRKSLDYYLH